MLQCTFLDDKLAKYTGPFAAAWSQLEATHRPERSEAVVEIVEVIEVKSGGLWVLVKINGKPRTAAGAKDTQDAARRLAPHTPAHR